MYVTENTYKYPTGLEASYNRHTHIHSAHRYLIPVRSSKGHCSHVTQFQHDIWFVIVWFTFQTRTDHLQGLAHGIAVSRGLMEGIEKAHLLNSSFNRQVNALKH